MRWDRLFGVVALLATVAMGAVAFLGRDDDTTTTQIDEPAAPVVVISDAPPSSAGTADTAAPTTQPPTTTEDSQPATTDAGSTTPESSSLPPDSEPQVGDPEPSRGEVTVRVLNAGARPGAATTASDQAGVAGFDIDPPGDHDPIPFSYIIARAPSMGAALDLADLLGIDRQFVVALADQEEWANSARDSTDVLVLLGSDRR